MDSTGSSSSGLRYMFSTSSESLQRSEPSSLQRLMATPLNSLPRTDEHTVSVDNAYSDYERQTSLRYDRRPTRNSSSYRRLPSEHVLSPSQQFGYLLTKAREREWGTVADFLQQLGSLEDSESDRLKELLRADEKDCLEVLAWAVEDNQVPVVKHLTARNLVQFEVSEYRKTLCDAVRGGKSEIVELLLKNYKKRNSEDFGAFVNTKSKQDGKTLLHYACEYGKTEVAKKLLDLAQGELNFNLVNKDGDTPLHVAITVTFKNKQLDILDLLCTRGKKKLLSNKKNTEGKTPYQRVWEQMCEWKHADEDEDLRDTAELMKQMLLRRKEVNDRRDEFYRERDFLQNVATSLLVGGTLLASIAAGGFLQMPKLPPPEDFASPAPSANSIADPSTDLESRKYWYIRAIDIFRCSNTISFFLSIITIIASIRVMISRRDRLFIEKEVSSLERSIRVASIALTLSTAVAVVAFVSSGLSNIPVVESGWSRVISQWGKRHYVPILKSTTLTTSVLGLMFVAPIVVWPLVKDYWWFCEEYRRERSAPRMISLLFASALIATVLFMFVMVIFGMGLL